MTAETLTESIVIMQDGKLAVPAEIRENFSLSDGCKVMFIADGEGRSLMMTLQLTSWKCAEVINEDIY